MSAPRASHRAEDQRHRLYMATMALPMERARRTTPGYLVVLGYLIGRLPAVPLRGIGEHTGMSSAEVAAALRELEDNGQIAPGSIASGRASFTTPAVLDALGVPEAWCSGWSVREDIPATSGGIASIADELDDEYADDEARG